ncbi:MAG: glycosyltransferase [Actinomycetota bacterium]
MSARPGSEQAPTCLFAHPGAELFGADRMLAESVVAARERGFACVVVLPERGPLVDVVRRSGARVVISPSFVLRKELLRPRKWPRLARDVLRGGGSAWRLLSTVRPDCVYVSTVVLPLWPIVARLRGVPTISHIHEAESGRALANRVLYAPQRASSRVVSNSGFTRATIERSVPSLGPRTRVVYNGVAAPLAAVPPRPRLDPPLRVLYVGRLSPRKGPDVAIEAVRLLLEVGVQARIDLVGSPFRGYEWFEAQLRDAVRDARLSEHVVLHGFREDVAPFLAAADVLVVPSREDESFGNTAVEGILARRPVVASDLPGLREAVGDYPSARLVPPGDAPALARALQELAGSWDRVVGSLAESTDAATARHRPSAYREQIGDHLLELVTGERERS